MSPLSSHLDLRELPLRGGERVERRVPVQIDPITLGGLPYDTLVQGDVAVVSVARVSGGFLVTVEMAASVYGPCSRCLRDVVLAVKAEQEEFVPQDPVEVGGRRSVAVHRGSRGRCERDRARGAGACAAAEGALQG